MKRRVTMPKRRKTARRKARRGPASPAMRRKKPVPFWMVMAAVLVVIGGAYLYLSNRPTGKAPLDYAEEEVVRGNPIHAVHEMRAGPPIPFLPKDQPQPRIVVPESTYDFGRVGPTSVVRYRFPVRNTGEAPLTISRAYTTCGCTTADFTARVIPPGKVALVTLTFDAGIHDARGQNVRRGVIIENNDRRQPKAEVWTRASVSWY